MISNQRILMVGSTGWEYPGELQIICEILSGANNIIWISPFGRINANLLPRIEVIKDSLTIYNPGINYLPLAFLDGFNRSRLLLHTKLYLLERDFEPDLVMIDHPDLLNFAAHYKKAGARSIYYRSAESFLEIPREDRVAVENSVDYVYKAQALPVELTEEEYLLNFEAQVDDITKMLNRGPGITNE